MDFNTEQTLKEVNVSKLTDNWDVINEGIWSPVKCMDINCSFGYTTRYFLLPELHNRATIIGKNIINCKRTYNNILIFLNSNIYLKVLIVQKQ